jgi:small subunit ribosomal protein S17
MAEEEQQEEQAASSEQQAADDAAAAPEEAPAEESAEAPAEAEPAADEPAGDTPRAAEDAAADVEPEEQLSPKERRRRARSAHTGESKPERSGEERAAERIEERKAKAASRRRYRQGRGKVRRDAVERGEGTPAREREPGNPKVRQGIVVSDKMDKTITVRVESARRHPTYEKVIRSSKMYHAHDERNEAGPGDTVRLVECRPMSKTKHWRLTEILERAK